jgi:hypothetical protein
METCCERAWIVFGPIEKYAVCKGLGLIIGWVEGIVELKDGGSLI